MLEVDVTANRGDAQSHRSLARDLAAKLGAELSPLGHAPLAEGEPLVPDPPGGRGRRRPSTPPRSWSWAGRQHPRPGAGLPGGHGRRRQGPAGGGRLQRAAAPLRPPHPRLRRRQGEGRHHGALGPGRARPWSPWTGWSASSRPRTCSSPTTPAPSAWPGLMGGDGTKVTASHPAGAAGERLLRPPHGARHGPPPRPAHRRLRTASAAAPIPAFARGGPGPPGPAPAGLGRGPAAVRLGGGRAARAPAGAIALPWAMLDRVAGHPVDHGAGLASCDAWAAPSRTPGRGCASQPPTWRHDLSLPDDLAEEVLRPGRLRGHPGRPAAPGLRPGAPGARTTSSAAGWPPRLANLGFFQTVTLGFGDPQEHREGHGLGRPRRSCAP